MSNRREFLKQAGVLGTAAILTQTPPVIGKTSEGPQLVEMQGQKPGTTISMRDKLQNMPPRRQITIPNVGDWQVLKGDFHIHTIFSDGTLWPKERVIEAAGNGLDVIAITDHIEYRPNLGGSSGLKLADRNDDHNISYDIAKPEADQRKIILVRGTEITKSKMPPGHFNALFFEDANRIAAQVSDYRKMFEETVRQGGFLLWNHPGWEAPGSGGIEKGAPTIFTPEHEEIFKNGWMHGIEAFNQYDYYSVVSDWVEEKDLATFANSDIHQTEIETYGVRNPRRPITLVFAKERTHDAVKEAFFAKRTVGWAADMILGREKWLKPLFEACVEIHADGGTLAFVNKSSLPVVMQVGNQTVNLSPLGMAEAKRTASGKFLVATNWHTGMDKRLEIAIP
ncbi:MAG: hypothetical protein FWC50_07685 [Planctomycetaceae bacterium]|nr:hypothetical protein [Planctomycetaceae bacterium]